MATNTILPVILCGGSGTRLWPISRESFPKQYLKINPFDDRSLLQKTQERILSLENTLNPILICNEEHRFIAAEQMREINVKPNKILLEPFGRNTAPAIALAALNAVEQNNNPHLLVLSADHEIKNNQKFLDVIKKGLDYSNEDKLVTFGIIPTSPETGFGYIEGIKQFEKNQVEGIKIKRFVEKPNLELAKKFLKDKSFTWNSGMFLFKAETILSALAKYSPEVLENCKNSIKEKYYDYDFQRLNKDAFEKCPDISIDVAIMEKTKKGYVLPLEAGWSDIGSWKSIWENSEKNKQGNLKQGKVVLNNTKNCLFKSEDRLLVGIGVQNLVVVETNDAVLVADKNETEAVKKIVKNMKSNGFVEVLKHKKIFRPWGYFISIEEGSEWQIKKIEVKPGASLSLQMHKHRSEHWIVVRGIAKVELDSLEQIFYENQSTYIPIGSKHRLSNPGKSALVLIEVQTGSYLGEDDIIRFDDKYGRVD